MPNRDEDMELEPYEEDGDQIEQGEEFPVIGIINEETDHRGVAHYEIRRDQPFLEEGTGRIRHSSWHRTSDPELDNEEHFQDWFRHRAKSKDDPDFDMQHFMRLWPHQYPTVWHLLEEEKRDPTSAMNANPGPSIESMQFARPLPDTWEEMVEQMKEDDAQFAEERGTAPPSRTQLREPSSSTRPDSEMDTSDDEPPPPPPSRKHGERSSTSRISKAPPHRRTESLQMDAVYVSAPVGSPRAPSSSASNVASSSSRSIRVSRSDSHSNTISSTGLHGERPHKRKRPRSHKPTISVSSDDEAVLRDKMTKLGRASDCEHLNRHRSTVAETALLSRSRIQRQLDEATSAAQAARVKIVNSVDDEAAPLIMMENKFRYLECQYDVAPGIEIDMDDFLIPCDCDSSSPVPRRAEASAKSRGKQKARNDCNPSQCIHGEDPITDAQGEAVFVYDEVTGLCVLDRLESDGQRFIVVECHKKCACADEPDRCPNRLSQRPRSVEIELYKTHNRGWAVRAASDLRAGEIVGLFTGELITRKAYNKLPSDLLRGYGFDLDFDDRVPEDQQYTVNCYNCGNWSRFINHSCDPNLMVYPVVHDTPPSSNIYFLAYVTTVPIPARTELCIDYDPAAAGEKLKGRPRKQQIRCSCASKTCRGWL